MDYIANDPTKLNSCCLTSKYQNYNLNKANPFDQRMYRQPNQWCSNDLILRDPAMRCKALIQPLDVTFDQSIAIADKDARAKGIAQFR